MTAIDLQIRTPFGPGAYLVYVRGVLDELAELPRRLSSLNGVVIMNLSELSRITSFGIRDWLAMLRTTRAAYVAFCHCRPSLLRQFNMIKGFGGKGELISFYVPCLCTVCGLYFENLVDLRFRTVSISSGVDVGPCPQCAGLSEFDEFIDYLDYPAHCAQPKPPHIAQLLLDRRAALDKLTIAKRVEGDVTRVSLFGSLVRESKLRRWIDGLEGELHLDMGGLREITQEGLEALAELVASSGATRCLLDGVRLESCEEIRAALGPLVTVSSLIAPGRCGSCRATVGVLLGRPSEPAPTMCHHCFDDGSISIPSAIEKRSAAMLSQGQRARSSRPTTEERFVASSPGFCEVIKTATDVAQTDATVLILGETGTGKELVARHIHAMSERRDRPFVAVNSSAFPEGLIESELFGHEAGAFTGATTRRLGRFERADTGTLFLDEVGDLPPKTQVKLLRTLQERYIERVGGHESVAINIRLIAATNRDITKMVRTGGFRSDLYYRLNVVPLEVPALRERREDITDLINFYMSRFQRRTGKKGITVSPKTLTLLLGHDWPGNVRELINWVERAVALTPSHSEIDVDDLGTSRHRSPRGSNSLKQAVDDFERNLIEQALTNADGNRSAAAKDLGISRQALRHKLIKHGLYPE